MTILDSMHTLKLKIFFLATLIFFAVSVPADNHSYDQFSAAVNSTYIDNTAGEDAMDDPSIDLIYTPKLLTNNPPRFVLITSDRDSISSDKRIHSIRAPPQPTFV